MENDVEIVGKERDDNAEKRSLTLAELIAAQDLRPVASPVQETEGVCG